MTSNMELQNTLKYQCRSSINCFSGGTVYDRSVRRNSPVYTKSILKNLDLTKPIKRKYESLIDSNTHLDDDKFNDYIESSNITKPINNANLVNNRLGANNIAELKYYIPSGTRASSSPILPNFYNPDKYTANPMFTTACPLFLESSSSTGLLSDPKAAQEEMLSQFSSLALNPSDSSTSSNTSWQESNESSLFHSSATGFESTSRFTHKRKQTYIIRDDLYSEMPNDKENVEEELNQIEKLFKQAKINSLLKRRKLSNDNDHNVRNSHSPENRIFLNENHDYISACNTFSMNSNNSFNEYTENDENSFTNVPFDSLKISSEFTDPNYFDSISSFDQIESYIQECLFSTEEVGIPQEDGIFLTNSSQEAQVALDEKSFQTTKKEDDLNIMILENNSAETLLFSKSSQALEFGFQNIFNTSNDDLIDEILFSDSQTYKEVKLDQQQEGENTNAVAIQVYNKSLESVPPVESKDKMDRSGGFTYEYNRKTSSQKNDYCHIITDETIKQEGTFDQSDFSFTSCSQNDSSLTYDEFSEETITCSETETQKSSVTIKIKIKRVSNDEKSEYVIDDSILPNMNENGEKTVNKFMKNIERYDCADCLDKFRTKKLLKSHVSAFHKGPYDTECNICHMKYRKSSAHKPHLPWCEKNKKYKCNLCFKEYCYNASLKKHLKTHSNPPFSKSSFEDGLKDLLV